MITPTPPISPASDQPRIRAQGEDGQNPVQELRKTEAPKPEKDDDSKFTARSVGALRQPVPAYDLRLTVEKDAETGEVVFKSINRLTGEVVKQLPNAEVLAMKRREQYEAGSIIQTQV